MRKKKINYWKKEQKPLILAKTFFDNLFHNRFFFKRETN
jgi:hypothetical protein